MTTVQELFKRIRRIEITTARLVDELLQGAYRSAFKGNGLEFDEVRPYQEGDEVRSIDWNVSARFNAPYTKTFVDERQLTVMLLIDLSASLRYGTTVRTKQDLIAEIAAVLAFSAIKNHDKIGVIFFTDRVEKYIPPRGGSRHVLRVIREILGFTPQSTGTDIECALSFLRKVQPKSCVTFVISDFITGKAYSQGIKVLSQRYDLVAIKVSDRREEEIPDIGLVNMRDLERGTEAIVDFSDTEVQKAFKEVAKKRSETVKKMMFQLHAGYVSLRTDQSYELILRRYFAERRISQ